MTDSRTCKRCGAQLQPAGSLQGLCPACLMGLGMAREARESRPAHEGLEAPPDPAELAAALPAFEIEEIVGQGGMGVVYRARQKSLDRTVALKVLPASLTRDPSFHDRFAREARALASLNHPNIVGVYDFGSAGGHYFLAMEFVDGTDLRRLLRTEDVSPRQALTLVGQLCDALQYAHDQGVVHRDIKPENVLIDRQGRVKVSDFGLAKLVGSNGRGPLANPTLTRADQIMGTPMYMAPEQVEHPLEVDHRADLYSLGVVFYELLTGELPLGRFAAPSMAHAGLDARLDPIVLRALEKEPPARYQQAGQMKTDVDRVASGAAVTDESGFVVAAAATSDADAKASRKRGLFRKHDRRNAGRDGKDREARERGGSPTTWSCLAVLGVALAVVMLLGCLGALFLGATQVRREGPPSDPVPMRADRAQSSHSVTLFPDSTDSVVDSVQTTPPGAGPASLESEQPVLRSTVAPVIDWESGSPQLAEGLREKNGLPVDVWGGARSLVDDARAHYLTLEADHVHALPGTDGVTVVVDAFSEERAALIHDLEAELETALGHRLNEVLQQELSEQVFPLGQHSITLELRSVDGVVHSGSKQAPHLRERGPRAMERFGHLLEPLYVAPPDAAAAVLALEQELATLVDPPISLSLASVEARSKFSRWGPVVEVIADLRIEGSEGNPLALWADGSRELLERDWVLETAFQGDAWTPLVPEASSPPHDILRSVSFVLQLEDARNPVPLLQTVDAQQVQSQALDLNVALVTALGGMKIKTGMGPEDSLRPTSTTLRGRNLEVPPSELTTVVASLSSVAAQFHWQTVEVTWSGGDEPKLEFQLMRVRR